MSLPPLASATSLTANWPGWLHANPPSATWCNSTGSRGVTGRSPVDTTAEAHQRLVSLREPSASSRRYLGTAIRHRSGSPARGLVCQPSGSGPGGLASWTSATDTPCLITTELRCCQDAGPLCMFQQATVSMAASSQTGLRPARAGTGSGNQGGGRASPPPSESGLTRTAAPRPGGRHHAAPAPLTTYAAGPPGATLNAHRPLSAAHAEPHDLHTLTAVLDAPALRAESALYG